MTIAHLSDTHLGFRAYARTTASGFNQREADVMNTFVACLDAIAERDPDVVVHAGDLFHIVRPSNATIVRAFNALGEFQRKRGGKPFVLIGGNHDTPRTAESGNLLNLFGGIPGLRLVTRHRETIEVPELDLEVTAVPSHSLLTGEPRDYEPTTGRKHSLLTLHGMAAQALPDHAQFDVAETRHDRWSYVALGDYHSFQKYGANVCYAGSTDFASTNIWDEVHVPKGWVWFDTATGKMEPVRLATRPVHDLKPINAASLSPEAIEGEMEANGQSWNPEEMPIVRQRIVNVHPSIRGKLNVGLVRELAARALSYQVATYPPKPTSEGAQTANGTGVTLEQSWQEHVERAELPASVARESLRDLGLGLLREVAERE